MLGVRTVSDFRNSIQNGFWLVKLVLMVLAIVGTFFIPNSFFVVYGWVALVVSGFFIVVQLIYLIGFAHTWAENWIGKMEDEPESEKKWWWALFLTSMIMLSVTLVGTIVMYVYFGENAAECQKNVAFITMNLILCFVISITSIHPKVQEYSPRSGLLQASLICAYVTYLIFSSNMSDDSECNPWSNSTGASNVSLLIGASFTIIAVGFSVVSAAGNQTDEEADAESGGTSAETEPLNAPPKDEESVNPDKKVQPVENPDAPVAYNYSRYHLIFAMGAMYISMLMTDWSTVYSSGTDTVQVDTGLAAVWVKAISSWFCIALYMWTLMAPVLMPDRHWGRSY